MATPDLRDPSFSRTVVLLLAHGDEGAFGVVLNRPSDTAVSEVLPQWAEAAAHPAVLFFGGPVGLDGVVGLGRFDEEVLARGPIASVVGRVATVDLNEPPDPTVSPGLVRLFVGSAGWGGGQLEAEVEEGSWFVVDAAETDAATAAPDELWTQVLRRQPGRLSWFANAAGDPGLN